MSSALSGRPAAAAARKRGRGAPVIDPARCTGCGRCVAVCEPHVLVLEPRGWEKSAWLIDAAGCTGCAACAPICPFRAITLRRR